ncbi:hypothetical protein, partial [Pseudomonas aeruginosa]
RRAPTPAHGDKELEITLNAAEKAFAALK